MTGPRANNPPLGGEALRSAIITFRDGHDTALIASNSADGTPNASYAPYISDPEHALYIFVSQLAAHTDNLLSSGQASALFIRDEDQSPNLFARQRLTYQCSVTEISASSPRYRPLLEQMNDRFGAVIKTLRQLPDFHLLKLHPTSGRYIEGFGSAYQWPQALPDDGTHHLGPSK